MPRARIDQSLDFHRPRPSRHGTKRTAASQRYDVVLPSGRFSLANGQEGRRRAPHLAGRPADERWRGQGVIACQRAWFSRCQGGKTILRSVTVS